MGRKTKTTVADDFVGVVARLPWWCCVVLAALSYLVLAYFAKLPAPTQVKPGSFAPLIWQTWGRALAMLGQYLIPFLCLLAALMSAMGREKRRSLVNDVAQSKAADALNGMSWLDFELLVGEAFRLQGYEVAETGGGRADGGVDLVLRRGNEKLLVQCKQWRALSVGVQPVRELYGLMAASGATGGFVVCSGRFSQDAVAFAEGRNVALIDGPKLRGLIHQAKDAEAPKRTEAQAPRPAHGPTAATAIGPPVTSEVPVCSACSKGMVLRTARRGLNAGKSFWGCSGYPMCRQTQRA